MAKRRRVQLPARLLRELIPNPPAPVPLWVYADGPTARTMERPRLDGYVVVADSLNDRHAARLGERTSLCGRPVVREFPKASVLIVECRGCEAGLPTPNYYT